MKAIAALVVAALLRAGGAVAQTSPSIPPTIKSIGVVTVIPSKMHIYRFGVLDTACDRLGITNLRLDKAAFDGATRAFSPGYKMIRTTVDPDAVIRTSNTEVMGAFKSFPGIGQQVRQISRAEGQVDAYLLIWSSHAADKCALKPGMIGLGVGLTKNLFSPPNLHIFAGLNLRDARTLQILWSRELRPSYKRLDNFEWRDSFAELTPQQRQLISTLLPQMVANAVWSTSRELLIGRCRAFIWQNTRIPRESSAVRLLQIRLVERHDRLGGICGGGVDRIPAAVSAAELHLHGIDAVGRCGCHMWRACTAVVPTVFAGAVRRHVVGGEDLEPVGLELPEKAVGPGHRRGAGARQQPRDEGYGRARDLTEQEASAMEKAKGAAKN